jgi:hypothetical protein
LKYKTVWTGTLNTKTYILNNSPELKAERFELKDILNLANCKHIRSLSLYRNKGDEPIDLSLLMHIDDLESLTLEKVGYRNMAALSRLTRLESLFIEDCKCFKFSDLEGLNQVRHFSLYDNKIDFIPDGFGNNRMESLESISLSKNRLKHFPSNLNLDNVRSLRIANNDLCDIEFVAGYPGLEKLDVSSNEIRSLFGLTKESSIEILKAYDNPILDIAPAVSLQKLEQLRVSTEINSQAQSLGLPVEDLYPENVDSVQYLEAKRIVEGLDREKYHRLTNNFGVRSAISRAFDLDRDDVVALLLSHPDKEIYEYVIQAGVYSIWSSRIELFEAKCLESTDRLIPALVSAFHYYYENLDHWSLSGGDFFSGRFKQVHLKILSIAMKIPGPDCSELFKLYLDDYKGFSFLHGVAFKRLFSVIKKTKDPTLTVHVIRTIPCEKYILGGDAAYLKKALNAVKSLGNDSHLGFLKETWGRLGESREDVVKVYEETLRALERRVVK